MFKDYGVISYPDSIDESAIYLGKMRDLMRTPMNEECKRFKRGEKGELVNILGIQAELIVEYFVFSKGLKYSAPKIITLEPVAGPDITIKIPEKEIKVDIKGAWNTSTSLLVNKEAHLKEKDVSHYWFVQPFQKGKANYWIFKHDEIDDWEVLELPYGDAYAKDIRKLIDEKTKITLPKVDPKKVRKMNEGVDSKD